MLNFQFDPFTPFSALVLPLNRVSFFGFVPLKIGYSFAFALSGINNLYGAHLSESYWRTPPGIFVASVEYLPNDTREYHF